MSRNMEEKRPTPLPPGVIPSSSNEDLYAQLQADSDARKREEKLMGPVRAMQMGRCGLRMHVLCGDAMQEMQKPLASEYTRQECFAIMYSGTLVGRSNRMDVLPYLYDGKQYKYVRARACHIDETS